MLMLNRIIDAPPALRRFIEARSKHAASIEELKLLAREAAEEAARAKGIKSVQNEPIGLVSDEPEAPPRERAKLRLVGPDPEQNHPKD